MIISIEIYLHVKKKWNKKVAGDGDKNTKEVK